MVISGLVVVFGTTDAHSVEHGGQERARTLSLLAARSDLTLGEAGGGDADALAGPTRLLRIPAVLESETPRASRASIEWIESLPGVTAVEVVHIGYDDRDGGTNISLSEGARRR